MLLAGSGSHRAGRVNLRIFFFSRSLSLSTLFPLRQTSEQTSDPLVPSAAASSLFFSLLLLGFFFFFFFKSDSSHTRLGTEAGRERTLPVAPCAQ